MANSFLLICAVLVAVLVSVNADLRGRFIHLTDTHVLRAYKKGTDPKSFCVKGTGRAAEFGDFDCDTAPVVANFTIEALKHREKPDFIMYGGDHIAYWDENLSLDGALSRIKDISDTLHEIRDAYGSDVRVFPILGNHDTFPFFQFPTEGPFYIYDYAAEQWKDFLQPSSLKTVRQGGYYTELIEPGLRLVVVNTAMYFIANFFFNKTLVDPGGQLAWMRTVLQQAKDNGELVFVAAHIPPGATMTMVPDMWDSFNDQFVRAFEGFNGNPVVASFYGHHHWTTFRIIHDEDVPVATNKNSHVGFVSSSLTPCKNVNPVFTEYTFMPKAPYTVIDRSYEYINITQANIKGSLEWSKAKSYGELFGLQTLDSESMSKVIARMHNEPDLFHAYYQDVRTHSPFGDTECNDESCKIVKVCGLNNTLNKDIQYCIRHWPKTQGPQ